MRISCMWGFAIALTALADRLAGRRRGEKKRCDVCDKEFGTLEQMEEHRRLAHPDRPV